MSVIIVDNESKYTNALLKILHQQKPEVINYKDLDYKKLTKGDIVILTGGHGDPILWHKKQYLKETELIKKHKGPIIGICLGFELIAHVYGSHLHFLNERRKGEVALTPSKNSPLVIPASVEVYENHNWSVQKLKRPLRALAYSKDGIEIFKHSRKPIYGLQFHPEESSSGGMAVFSAILEDTKS
ncbi:MAG: glutamine amidotransferase-related protein [Candidatus Saccharimonadaceae bacterium]